MAELSETVEPEHFAEATTSHIQRHWNHKTHKKHSATRRIRSKRLLKSVVRKEFISHRLFAESQALKPIRKLHQCTSCTDKATPWMSINDNKCETSGLVLTKCRGNKHLSRNKNFQLIFLKLIMAMKVMTVVRIRLHAIFAQMKQHHGIRTTINTAAVLLCF